MDDTTQPEQQQQPDSHPGVVPPSSPSAPPTIPIEETPEILPVAEHEAVASTSPPPPPPAQNPPPKPAKSGSFMSSVGTIIIFIALFVVGMWLSSYVRQFMPSGLGSTTPKPTAQVSPSPTGVAAIPKSNDPYASWKTYNVISGITKQPIEGVQYKLPADILPPICDGSGCASQGTYLPGGTRLTVAPRGTGQALRDSRGTVISDVNGTVFTTKVVTVGGRQATEFSGTFSGRTISGYVFSKMRGVMIEISDTVSLEINHFTPNGIASDFEKDEVLFDSILKTVVLPGGTKGSVLLPSATLTVSPTSTATVTATITPSKTPTATPTGL